MPKLNQRWLIYSVLFFLLTTLLLNLQASTAAASGDLGSSQLVLAGGQGNSPAIAALQPCTITVAAGDIAPCTPVPATASVTVAPTDTPAPPTASVSVTPTDTPAPPTFTSVPPSTTSQPSPSGSPAITATATATATPTPDCTQVNTDTIKGDDRYTVTIPAGVQGNICAQLQISRYYGPLQNPAAAQGVIDPAAIGTTIIRQAVMRINTNGPAGNGTLVIAGQNINFNYAAGNQTTLVNFNTNNLQLPNLRGDLTIVPPNLTPPLAVANAVKVTLSTGAATRINWLRADIAGMRPLLLVAGFDNNPTAAAACVGPIPPVGVNHCLVSTAAYWGWNWGIAATMTVNPLQDRHAGIIEGGAALDSNVNNARTIYGVAEVNILGHSMGGLWGRRAAQVNPGSIDKLMMLGTPNSGSRWADTAVASGQAACALVARGRPVQGWFEPWLVYQGRLQAYLAAIPICDLYNAVQPALGHLTIDYMRTVYNNPARLAFEAGLDRTNQIKYIDLAGQGTTVIRGVTVIVPPAGDGVVSVTSVQALPFSRHLPVITLPYLPFSIHYPRQVNLADFQTPFAPFYSLTANNYPADLFEPTTADQQPLAIQGEAATAYSLGQFGQVQPGTVATRTLTVDHAERVAIAVSWLTRTTSLGLRLQDPTGRIIDQNSTYDDVYFRPTLDGVAFTIENPTPGAWLVSITTAGGSSEPYYLTMEFDGGVQVNPSVNLSNPVGAPLTISAEVRDAAPLANATVVASVSNVAASTNQTITLISQGSGLYSGSFTPAVVGDYMVYVEAVGNNGRGEAFNRGQLASFQVNNGGQMSNTYAEEAQDSDGDSLYNGLMISSTLNGGAVGDYEASGCLTASDGTTLACASSRQTLMAGNQQIALTFDGNQIGAANLNGPYQLRDLMVVGPGGMLLAQMSLAYTTTTYSRYAWQRQAVILAGPANDQGVDSNGNGQFEFLEVSIPLDVRLAGSYNLSLNLVGPNGSQIATTGSPVSLVAGANTVTLRFNASEVVAGAQNGPYRLTDLSLTSTASQSYVADVLTTAPYLLADFEGGAVCALTFSDVPTGNAFYNDIRYLGCRNVVSGLPNGDGTYRFEPNSNTTRGQFAKIASLGFGFTAYRPAQATFSDVSLGNIFSQYVEAAAFAGAINGLNQNQCTSLGLQSPCFGVNLNVNRVQVSVIVKRARGYVTVSPPTPSFRDLPSTAFGYVEVETLKARGIVSGNACTTGSGQCYLPNNNVRRGELSKITHRAMASQP